MKAHNAHRWVFRRGALITRGLCNKGMVAMSLGRRGFAALRGGFVVGGRREGIVAAG